MDGGSSFCDVLQRGKRGREGAKKREKRREGVRGGWEAMLLISHTCKARQTYENVKAAEAAEAVVMALYGEAEAASDSHSLLTLTFAFNIHLIIRLPEMSN